MTYRIQYMKNNGWVNYDDTSHLDIDSAVKVVVGLACSGKYPMMARDWRLRKSDGTFLQMADLLARKG
jgi:hypothetical protein